MSFDRQMKRALIRKAHGNRALQSIWKNLQIAKYGRELWIKLRVAGDPRGRKASSITDL